MLSDKLGFDYNEYWTKQGILTPQQILRMQEVNLVADIVIAMVEFEGIKSKKANQEILRFIRKTSSIMMLLISKIDSKSPLKL